MARALADAPRLGLLLLLGASLLLAACGGKQVAPEPIERLLERLQAAEGDPLDAIAAEVAQRAESDPSVIDRLVTLLRLDEANAPLLSLVFRLADPGALPSHAERREAMTKAAKVMAYRLQAIGQPGGTFDLQSDGASVSIELPKPLPPSGLTPEERLLADRVHEHAIVRSLTAPGSVELLLTVPPPGGDEEPRSLWTGVREGYDALVESQAGLIDASVRAGTVYAPQEPGFLVSAVLPAEGRSVHGFLMTYRAPNRAEHFDRADFALRAITFLATEQVGLELAVRPERQAAMRAWTAAHKGRRLVLVVNGVAGAPIRLAAPIDKTALIVYGSKGDAAALANVASILRVMGTAPHRVPIVGTRARRVGRTTPTPAAIALVASGAAGARRMNELRHEDGPIGPRAAYILEMIGRHQASGGKRAPGARR